MKTTVPDQIDDILVHIHARVVPNGMVDGKPRATLLLSPAIDQGREGGVPLSCWPRAVHQMLKSRNYALPALLSPTIPGKSAVALDGAEILHGATLHATRLPDIETRLDAICDMWRRSLWTGEGGEKWPDLAKRLDASLRGQSVQPGKLSQGKDAEEDLPDPDIYGADAQLSPDTDLREAPATLSVDAALAIRHSDLALALENTRARALCSSLHVALGNRPTHVVPTFKPRDPVTLAGHAAGNLFLAEKNPDAQILLAAIAAENPRQPGQTLETYRANLKSWLDANRPGHGMDDLRIKELLEQDKAVVAELRRKRRMAERAALHGLLDGDRKNSRALYKQAQGEMIDETPGPCAPPDWKKTCLTAAGAAGPCDFTALTNTARYANWPQYKTPGDPNTKTHRHQADETLEQAARAFFTMQSTPSLSRAFLLAIDVTLEPATPGADPLGGIAGYGRIAADLGELDSHCIPRNWTLFSNTPHSTGGAFWPATRGEADCNATRNSTRQYGGLMVMGFGASTAPEDHAPRFDITSLDIRTALELEIQQVSIKTADKEAADLVQQQPRRSDEATGDKEIQALKAEIRANGAASVVVDGKEVPLAPGMNPPSPEAGDQQDEGDRQDVGLTLLDRGMIGDAVRKLAVKQAKCGADAQCQPACDAGVVIDAEDLTTGYRLYVGTPKGRGAPPDKTEGTDWRPLMARSITFGTSGPDPKLRDAIEPVLGALIGKAGSPGRIGLESASINVPGRMLPKKKSTGTGQEAEAVFEEAVSVWDGGPMGVDCSEAPGQANTTGDALIFGRTLAVPRTGPDRPPRLRFGRPYRFALAAVFSGGRSVPQDEFPADAANTPAEDLYYPSDAMQRAAAQTRPDSEIRPYVRALRQAKIGAPQALVPQGHATRSNGPMGPDTAGQMVIRSLDAEAARDRDPKLAARAVPRVAQRIVVVPSVPQARAVAHADWREGSSGQGLLDGSGHLRNGPPRGTFGKVRHHGAGATFPAIRTAHLKGLNGRQHFDSRRIVDAPEAEAMRESEVQDGAVFAPRGWHDSQYYPDPAAGHLAVRLTLRGRDGRIVMPAEDKLLNLSQGLVYPDRHPVVLSLRGRKPDGIPVSSWAQIATSARTAFNPARRGDITGGGSFSGIELALALAPHEWVDIEMWFVPEARQLARDFAIIQALAIQLSQKQKPALACCAVDVSQGAQDALPDEICAALSQVLSAPADAPRAYFGPGGVVAPPMSTLLALAEQVRAAMVHSPIPEISGVARLSAVHAANRAAVAPGALGGATDHFSAASGAATCLHQPVRAWRPPEKRPAAAPTPANPTDDRAGGDTVIGPPDEPCLCPAEATPLDVAAPGSTALVLSGEVTLDLNEIDTLEVRARMVLPGSTTFDDRLRGRSLAHRRANWWPLVDDPRGAAATDPEARDFLPARHLFGFSVAADGHIALDQAEVTLLRAERLPRPGGSTCTQSVSLRALFEDRIDGVRITGRHRFPDGKARRMQVRLNGLPRTAELMKTADRVLRAGDPWIRSDGRKFQDGDLAPGEGLEARHQSRFGKPFEVVLPATIRPAKPDARAPEPGFRWLPGEKPDVLNGRLTHKRVSTIRIVLGREWFSSGEGERLGIVLWPPDLLASDDQAIRENRARIARDDGTGEDRIIDLNGSRVPKFHPKQEACVLSPDADTYLPPFEDRHLGPGGRYVSRRGADPVHEGEPHRQILLAPGDFGDLDLPEGDIRRAELVRNVEMPLSDESASDTKTQPGEKEGTEDASPTMLVSLLTYEPRFDVANEEWFVELSLADAATAETFVRLGLVRYQPHTRPGLRCSRPVRQEVKPLPARTVDVWRRKQGDGWRVRMCGPTFSARRVSDSLIAALGLTPPDGQDRDHAARAFTRCGLPAPDGYLSGPEAAPLMSLTFRRAGQDAQGRRFEEFVPLPVPGMGRDSLLLRPLDHETGILDPAPTIQPEPGALLAATILVKARFTGGDQGIWIADILDSALGDPSGLHLEVGEVITDERDAPPSKAEAEAMPVLSMRALETADVPQAPVKTAPDVGQEKPKERTVEATPAREELAYGLEPSLDLTGARFMGDFDLDRIMPPKPGKGGAK